MNTLTRACAALSLLFSSLVSGQQLVYHGPPEHQYKQPCELCHLKYQPPTYTTNTCYVYYRGGGFWRGSVQATDMLDADFIDYWVSSKQLTGFSVGYRNISPILGFRAVVDPDFTHLNTAWGPTLFDDAVRGLAYIQQAYSCDGMVLAGQSAGGAIALVAAFHAELHDKHNFDASKILMVQAWDPYGINLKEMQPTQPQHPDFKFWNQQMKQFQFLKFSGPTADANSADLLIKQWVLDGKAMPKIVLIGGGLNGHGTTTAANKLEQFLKTQVPLRMGSYFTRLWFPEHTHGDFSFTQRVTTRGPDRLAKSEHGWCFGALMGNLYEVVATGQQWRWNRAHVLMHNQPMYKKKKRFRDPNLHIDRRCRQLNDGLTQLLE